MTTETTKRLIRVRVEKNAKFKRDGYGKKRQLSASWRKPRGQHNKQREQKKAKGALPRPGFGSPLAVRGMHPSGFFEALVATPKELAALNPLTHAVRISGSVGTLKRVGLQNAAREAGFKILNEKLISLKIPVKETVVPAEEEKRPSKWSVLGKKSTPSDKKISSTMKNEGSSVQSPEVSKDE